MRFFTSISSIVLLVVMWTSPTSSLPLIIFDFLFEAFPTSAKTYQIDVITENNRTKATYMQYRETSYNQWSPFCWWYDFLQGSGFFPATWYQDIEPTVEVDVDGSTNRYRFQTKPRSLYQWHCKAQTDNVANYISITYTNKTQGLESDTTKFYDGSIPFRLGLGDESYTTVTCPFEEGAPFTVCDYAYVDNSESVEIFVLINN